MQQIGPYFYFLNQNLPAQCAQVSHAYINIWGAQASLQQ